MRAAGELPYHVLGAPGGKSQDYWIQAQQLRCCGQKRTGVPECRMWSVIEGLKAVSTLFVGGLIHTSSFIFHISIP